MEQEYRLTGTLPELQNLLQKEFEMSPQSAKLAACLLILEQRPEDETEENQSALWFLREHDQYATAILQTRYSISLTEARKNIIELLIFQFAGILLDNDWFAMTTILNCLWSVVKAGTHIQDNECCAYYQALKWKAIHPTQEYFTIDDILPNEPDRVCVHLDSLRDERWKCEECHQESCTTSKEKFKIVLDALCSRNVFQKINDMYRFAT